MSQPVVTSEPHTVSLTVTVTVSVLMRTLLGLGCKAKTVDIPYCTGLPSGDTVSRLVIILVTGKETEIGLWRKRGRRKFNLEPNAISFFVFSFPTSTVTLDRSLAT